jgi:hypothetical protein
LVTLLGQLLGWLMLSGSATMSAANLLINQQQQQPP